MKKGFLIISIAIFILFVITSLVIFINRNNKSDKMIDINEKVEYNLNIECYKIVDSSHKEVNIKDYQTIKCDGLQCENIGQLIFKYKNKKDYNEIKIDKIDNKSIEENENELIKILKNTTSFELKKENIQSEWYENLVKSYESDGFKCEIK